MGRQAGNLSQEVCGTGLPIWQRDSLFSQGCTAHGKKNLTAFGDAGTWRNGYGMGYCEIGSAWDAWLGVYTRYALMQVVST